MRKCLALMTRMKINTNILVFLSIFSHKNTVKLVLFFRAKVLFFNENQAKNGLKSLIFDDQNFLRTLIIVKKIIFTRGNK